MTVNVLVACISFCALAEEAYGLHRHLYERFQGPLIAASASPSSATAEPIYPPQPYAFGYDNVDEYGAQSYHKEQGDANNVKTGSYGYRDANGIYRRVTYVADENGFRATVDSNEPGMSANYPADATYKYNANVAGVTTGSKAASTLVPDYAAPAAHVAANQGYALHAPRFSFRDTQI